MQPLLMFDYDGVVVDSLEIHSATFIEACRHVGMPGVTTLEEVLALYDGNVYDGLAALGGTQEQAQEVVRRLRAAMAVALPALRPFPLMAQVMNELAEFRSLAIVSSNATATIQKFLRRNDINGVFEVAGMEAGTSKTEKIATLMERFPDQETYWYVGDTAGDMREALLAGATPLGVAWGWHSPEVLTEAGAAKIAQTPFHLLRIVAPDAVPDFLGVDAENFDVGAV